jgi:dTMP kinase
LKAGTTVLVDRYAYSGVVYSMARGTFARWDEAMRADEGLVAPDIVFHLDTPDAAALSVRYSTPDAEIYDDHDFQRKVQKTFWDFRDQLSTDTWQTIDARNDVDTIHNNVVHFADAVIKTVPDRPLTLLWQPYEW